MDGIVFDLKRYAMHDGPGIRTTVFFKGCPLDCPWCHNPESRAQAPELDVLAGRCIRCGECMLACPEHLAEPEQDGGLLEATCRHCFACAAACPTGARVVVGRTWSTAALMDEVEKDRPFFEESGGGVTFSGGEPLMQADFLRECLRMSKARGLHTAVDTCGYAPSEALLRIIPHTDLFLYDLKLMDPARHEAVVGVSNAPILENVCLLHRAGAQIRIRVPLVPGMTDDAENLKGVAAFVREALGGAPAIDLLPYHAMAQAKYRRRGLEPASIAVPSTEAVARAVGLLESAGGRVVVGG